MTIKNVKRKLNLFSCLCNISHFHLILLKMLIHIKQIRQNKKGNKMTTHKITKSLTIKMKTNNKYELNILISAE